MAETIQDGTGSGNKAKVDSGNKLWTLAVSVPLQHHNAHIHQSAFSLIAQQTPTGADDCFAYIKNDDSDELNVWELCITCAAAEYIEIWEVTGTAVGTDYAPVNLYIGSGKKPQTTCKVGNDVTGLTKVKLIKRYRLEAGKQQHLTLPPAIIIPESHAIGVYAVTGTALTDLCATFDFHAEN